jgi:hypothetical protein
MRLPAVCNNCGAIFPSRLIEVRGSAEAMYFEGNKEQCPVCGHMARLPDGLFNFANDAIEVLQAPDRTVEDLRRFVPRIGIDLLASLPSTTCSKRSLASTVRS